jgi:hypothetical protein
MEGGETDVLHFLFAKNEALIGRGIVELRDISSGHRGCRCTTEQRKPQSGRTQRRHGGGLGCAFLPRSLLDPSHGRILRSCERACRSKFALGERAAQDLPPCHKMKWNLGERAEPKRLRTDVDPLSTCSLSWPRRNARSSRKSAVGAVKAEADRYAADFAERHRVALSLGSFAYWLVVELSLNAEATNWIAS